MDLPSTAGADPFAPFVDCGDNAKKHWNGGLDRQLRREQIVWEKPVQFVNAACRGTRGLKAFAAKGSALLALGAALSIGSVAPSFAFPHAPLAVSPGLGSSGLGSGVTEARFRSRGFGARGFGRRGYGGRRFGRRGYGYRGGYRYGGGYGYRRGPGVGAAIGAGIAGAAIGAAIAR